jgi:hypothetical protein
MHVGAGLFIAGLGALIVGFFQGMYNWIAHGEFETKIGSWGWNHFVGGLGKVFNGAANMSAGMLLLATLIVFPVFTMVLLTAFGSQIKDFMIKHQQIGLLGMLGISGKGVQKLESPPDIDVMPSQVAPLMASYSITTYERQADGSVKMKRHDYSFTVSADIHGEEKTESIPTGGFFYTGSADDPETAADREAAA